MGVVWANGSGLGARLPRTSRMISGMNGNGVWALLRGSTVFFFFLLFFA